MSEPRQPYVSVNTDDESDAPLSAIARAIKEKIEVRAAMVIILDNDNDIALGTSGFATEQVPPVLKFLSQIVRAKLKGQLPPAMNADQVLDAGQCPGCGVGVMFARDVFEQSTGKPRYIVCQCGSFLVPETPDGGPVQVRCMTIEEVALLPDDVRTQMLRARRQATDENDE